MPFAEIRLREEQVLDCGAKDGGEGGVGTQLNSGLEPKVDYDSGVQGAASTRQINLGTVSVEMMKPEG